MGENLSVPEVLDNSRINFIRQLQILGSNGLTTPLTVGAIYSIQNNAKRVKTMLPSLRHNGAIPLTFTETRKDDEQAVTYRNMGNEEYKSKNYLKALELYSKSLAYASSSSENVCFAFANRSAVLFQLEQYTECIEELERAKDNNYPRTRLNKLKVRRETCIELLNSSHVELLVAKLSMDEVFSSQTQDMKESVAKNDEIPCASNSVKIIYDEKYGRHIIATKDIRAGDIIAIERPYSTSLFRSHLYTLCHNCCNRSLTLLPCEKCPNVMYCSVECRDTAWETFHEIECPILTTLFEADYYDQYYHGFLTSITAIKSMKIKKLKSIINEIESRPIDRTSGFTKDSTGKLVLDGSSYTSVHSLMANLGEKQAISVYNSTVAACSLLDLLRDHTSLKRILKDESNYEIFGGFILHHLLSHITYTIGTTRIETTSSRSEQFGQCTLPFHALFNHSCYPNVSLNYHYPKEGILGVSIAIMPIKKGQPLWICYTLDHISCPKKVRQEVLLKQYNFTCSCTACEKNFPLLKDLSEIPKIPDNFYDIHELTPAQALDSLPKHIRKLNKLAKKYPLPNRYVKELQNLIIRYQVLKGYRPTVLY